VPAQTKDGRTIYIEFTIVILRRNGKVEALAAIVRDVTKRFEEMRRLRQAAQRAD
jgi:PAS domain S-box-containing protein